MWGLSKLENELLHSRVWVFPNLGFMRWDLHLVELRLLVEGSLSYELRYSWETSPSVQRIMN